MRFRIHYGFTKQGRDRWKYFDTLQAATEAASRVFRHAGVVLSVQQAPDAKRAVKAQ